MHYKPKERKISEMGVNYDFLINMSSALLHEAADKSGDLPASIKPLHRGMVLCGTAYPVLLKSGSNYMLHRAIVECQEGDVIVAQVGEDNEYGYWGEIMTQAAIFKKIRGLVINGGVRDSAEIIELGFPIFSKGICMKGTTKHKEGGNHGRCIQIGKVIINKGDAIIGDADGVVVLPAEIARHVSEKAIELREKEHSMIREIQRGKSTIELLRLN